MDERSKRSNVQLSLGREYNRIESMFSFSQFKRAEEGPYRTPGFTLDLQGHNKGVLDITVQNCLQKLYFTSTYFLSTFFKHNTLLITSKTFKSISCPLCALSILLCFFLISLSSDYLPVSQSVCLSDCLSVSGTHYWLMVS